MKKVFVSGSCQGIGRAIAEKFASENYNVVLHFNNSEDQAQELFQKLSEINNNIEIVQGDLSKSYEVNRIFNRIGEVDILINNAGISEQILFTDITEEKWDNIFNVNVKSAFMCSKAVLPYMINKKRGNIINISSIWGLTGASCEVHYSATKSAIIGMTKALAKEVGPSGIRVNCVAPGVVNTNMLRDFTEEDLEQLRDETPLEIIGEPEDIAETVYFLASDKAKFITGQVISPNGGIYI